MGSQNSQDTPSFDSQEGIDFKPPKRQKVELTSSQEASPYNEIESQETRGLIGSFLKTTNLEWFFISESNAYVRRDEKGDILFNITRESAQGEFLQAIRMTRFVSPEQKFDASGNYKFKIEHSKDPAKRQSERNIFNMTVNGHAAKEYEDAAKRLTKETGYPCIFGIHRSLDTLARPVLMFHFRYTTEDFALLKILKNTLETLGIEYGAGKDNKLPDWVFIYVKFDQFEVIKQLTESLSQELTQKKENPTPETQSLSAAECAFFNNPDPDPDLGDKKTSSSPYEAR